MYSLMLIDDQENVIESMKSAYDWEEIGVIITQTATNGRDALELMLQSPPDIAFVDIEMPLMDGMTLVRRIREEGLSAKIVILTGHNQFDYAKEALRYGVTEYLLKPAFARDVIQTVQRIVAQLDKETHKRQFDEQLRTKLRLSMPLLVERFVENLLRGEFEAMEELAASSEFLGVELNAAHYRVITVQLDQGFDGGVLRESDRQYAKLYIVMMLREALGIKNTYTNFSGKNASFILMDYAGDNQELLETLTAVIGDCKQELGVSVSISVGSPVNCPLELRQSYAQAQECLKYKTNLGNGQVIFYDDILFTQIVANVSDYYDRDKLVEAVKMRSRDSANRCVSSFFDAVKQQRYLNFDYVKILINELTDAVISTVYQMGETVSSQLFEGRRRWEIVEESESIEELECFVYRFIEGIFGSISQKSSGRNIKIVEQIIGYVHEFYHEDISLAKLSQKIYLTPNYLSMIFSKHMGKNFNEYLIEYRMERARQLLSTNHYKVFEVAGMVGYKKQDHFRKLFKEYTGTTPSEYGKE